MTIREFQQRIEAIYFDKDSRRGLCEDLNWLIEEVGELSRALRRGQKQEIEGECADVLAWLCTLASIAGVDLQAAAVAKYESGCPKCGTMPCACLE